MNLKDTKLFFLEEDCIRQFNRDRGKAIYRQAEERYEKLTGHADYRGNEAVKTHLTMNLYPAMAYYQALQEEEFSQEDALAFVRAETIRAANIKKAEQAKLVKLPCAYLMFRLFVKSFMKKKFPPEGFNTRWIRCDGKGVHFDMTRCIYREICDAEGCPELCSVFCENDDIAFSGLMPRIRFERTGTLGKGADCCDFHFVNNRGNHG